MDNKSLLLKYNNKDFGLVHIIYSINTVIIQPTKELINSSGWFLSSFEEKLKDDNEKIKKALAEFCVKFSKYDIDKFGAEHNSYIDYKNYFNKVLKDAGIE